MAKLCRGNGTVCIATEDRGNETMDFRFRGNAVVGQVYKSVSSSHVAYSRPITGITAAVVVLLLAGCYESGGNRAAHIPTNEAQHQYQRAQAAVTSGNLEEAIARAGAAAKADPEFNDAALLHASILGRAGRYEEAQAVCAELVTRAPDFVQARLLQGILYDLSGDEEAAAPHYDAALAQFEAARAAGPGASPQLLLEGLTRYLRHGELEGVKAMNQFLSRFPEHPTALYLKACMQNKDRGFLLRWFTERGGNTPPDGGPEETRNNTPGE